MPFALPYPLCLHLPRANRDCVLRDCHICLYYGPYVYTHAERGAAAHTFGCAGTFPFLRFWLVLNWFVRCCCPPRCSRSPARFCSFLVPVTVVPCLQRLTQTPPAFTARDRYTSYPQFLWFALRFDSPFLTYRACPVSPYAVLQLPACCASPVTTAADYHTLRCLYYHYFCGSL